LEVRNIDVRNYLSGRKEDLKREAGVVKDFSVFDFSDIPPDPLMREEGKSIIDALLRYDHSGIPKNLAIFGSRGSGKTLMMRYLAHELRSETSLNLLCCNVRNHNTSFEILAQLLRAQARGASLDELFLRFRKKYPEKTAVILDEIDLMSPKDWHMEILYRLSRSSNNYMVILLSNSPRLLQVIDPSSRSTLQPEVTHFRNYDAKHIYEVLQARAQQGLNTYDKEDLRRIAGLTTKNTNSDVRVATKSLFYTATESGLSASDAFARASKDVVVDVIHDLKDNCASVIVVARKSTLVPQQQRILPKSNERMAGKPEPLSSCVESIRVFGTTMSLHRPCPKTNHTLGLGNDRHLVQR